MKFIHSQATQFALRAVGLMVCVFLIACSQPPKQSLHLNLTTGRSYILTISTQAEGTFTPPDGSSVLMDGSSEFRFVLTPEGTTDEGHTVILVEPEKAIFGLFFNQISEAFSSYSFRLHASPTGRITGFAGTDELRESVREALVNKPAPDHSMPVGVDILMTAISDEALTSLFQPLLAVWPSIPVTTGDTWERDDIYHPSSATLEKSTFKLDSMSGSEAKISMTSTLAPTGRDPMKDIRGTGSGEIRVSTMDGTIRRYESKQTLEGTTIVPENNTFDYKGKSVTRAELTAR